ncbi:ATP-binding protein [Endozoicomonas ascidiicola]|uniref:ATP-binding protein n=1 Tax=Endozoicomonas ascidiicola TaxID=1698521 RepID=UPI00082B5364|nr:ATP-binding protein [Endozoicomonas ascidiicola]
MEYIARKIEKNLQVCLKDTPVIIITGPRQSGKTTLAQHFLAQMTDSAENSAEKGSYLTLDDENILAVAQRDPIGLLRQQRRPMVIDEIQRAPELIRTIKMLVDEDRKPGSFILTGSADLMTLPTLADSLAGRAEFVTLYPFSQPELQQDSTKQAGKNKAPDPCSAQESDIIQQLLSADFVPEHRRHFEYDEVIAAIVCGGYPEVLQRSASRRNRWYRAYTDAIIRRDIKDVFQLQKLDEMGQLLKLLAPISSEALNYASLGKAVQMDTKSVQKYVSALENLYLVKRIPAWHRNELKRAIKQPKIHFVDTGLLCATRGINETAIKADRNLTGALMETWICSELLKAIAVSEEDCQLFHYRDKSQREVDFILANNNGLATGIEVKAGMTIKKDMFAALEMLIEAGSIQKGVIVYNGDKMLPFSDKLVAVPVGCLF